MLSEEWGAPHIDRSILTANLIVIGRIDSIYNDESFIDGLRSSASVTVLKTLKGDSNMKKLIIRKEGFVNNGFIVSFSSHRTDLLPELGKYYLLFLSKVNYEERLIYPLLITIGGHTPKLEFSETLKQMRQQCFDASITSLDLGQNMEALNNEKIKAKVDKVYEQCRKYGQFFPKSPLLEY